MAKRSVRAKRTSTKCKDVAQAVLLAELQSLLELVHGHVRTSQMHLHVEVDIAMRIDADLSREVARAATCAPRHIDKHGLVRGHAVNARIEVLHTFKI